MALASYATLDFRTATENLWSTWEDLKSDQVFRSDPASLARIGSRWLRAITFGGLLGTGHTFLLDTAPLRATIAERIDFAKIRRHLDTGALHGLAVSATNYRTGTAVTFFDGDPSIEPWLRSTRIAVREEISVDTVMASSAIPIFFPPVRLGGSFYGDGCIRLTAPLSPAVHMGADRILAVGIRYHRSTALTQRLNQEAYDEPISLADIGGILLNAVFLDSLETDLERMERINRTVALLDESRLRVQADQLRPIPVLAIKPSQDLGTLAKEHFRRFPRTLRFLLRGLGASYDKGWDLLSYLSFDAAYTRRLLELGYDDAMARKDELIAFFTPSGLPSTANSSR
jgi:NTE family protein